MRTGRMIDQATLVLHLISNSLCPSFADLTIFAAARSDTALEPHITASRQSGVGLGTSCKQEFLHMQPYKAHCLHNVRLAVHLQANIVTMATALETERASCQGYEFKC